MSRPEGARTPRLSISSISTPRNSVLEDVKQVAAAGADGIGLWLWKLRGTPDQVVAEAMRKSGVRATYCLPRLFTILPLPGQDASLPTDPGVRTQWICDDLPRIAAFNPVAVLVTGGVSGNPASPAGPISAVAEGLAHIADVASGYDLRVTFEILSARRGSPLSTLRETVRFVEALERDNVSVCLDIYHSWTQPGLAEELRTLIDWVDGVQVCDIRMDERSAFDRELPGRGRGVARKVMASLLANGYEGWWELEVFAGYGITGPPLPASYWSMPPEKFLSMAVEAFHDTYARASDIANGGAS